MKDRRFGSGCALSLPCRAAPLASSSWKAPDAEPFRMRGEKVAAVVMVNDDSIRLAGEEALARELSVRGAEGVPMYTLLAGAHPDEAKARAAPSERESWGSSCCDRYASTRRSRRGRPTRASWSWMAASGAATTARLGFCLVGWEIRTDTIIIVETLVYSLHQNKLVVGAKQDYESCKSESPDREHGQTGRRRARAARADYERGLITEEVHKSDHAVREHARVRAATRFRRTLGSIAWERKENEHDYPDQSRRYRTARILRGRVRDAIDRELVTELSLLRWKTTPSPVPTTITPTASV